MRFAKFQPIFLTQKGTNFVLKLHAVSPLGFTTPHKDMVGAYTISEVTDRAMVSVTARKNCGSAVEAILTNDAFRTKFATDLQNSTFRASNHLETMCLKIFLV